jgi:hypothetical protein
MSRPTAAIKSVDAKESDPELAGEMANAGS